MILEGVRPSAGGRLSGDRWVVQRNTILHRYQQWIPDMRLGLQNLLLHRLRSLLTMLGMIFGVAAVVSMLSIGAGARQSAMALIEQLGVNNLIVEAKETWNGKRMKNCASTSPGLTFKDYRVIRDDLPQISVVDAAQTFDSNQGDSQTAAGYPRSFME